MSPASIRSTMSELEAKGFLFHMHTSAGRIPTDLGYRLYVNDLMRLHRSRPRIRKSSPRAASGPHRESRKFRRAAQVLGVLTQELGVAAGPRLDAVVLDRLDLVHLSSERLLLVFNLKSGAIRTIFVQIPASIAPGNRGTCGADSERASRRALAPGHSLDARGAPAGRGRQRTERELLNIFVAEGEESSISVPIPDGHRARQRGAAADQPEFASNARMRGLLQSSPSAATCSARRCWRASGPGSRSPSGRSNDDARLADFTLVTSSYRLGELSGVIGVIGPTRMPYDKIIGLVQHTSRLVEGLIS
jgi:heat-inducible transcriptional repressor